MRPSSDAPSQAQDLCGMPNLSDHDLRQMDPTWQQRQPEDTVRGLLARALDDLRQARDRLKQDPTNSSRPSGSMEPWRSSGEAEAAVSSDAAASDDVQAESKAGELEAKAPEAPRGGADGVAPRGLGKPAGAAGFGRTQKLALTDTERHRPLQCAACGQPLDEQAPCSAWSGWDSIELAGVAQALGLRLEVTRRHLLMQSSAVPAAT